ncbi:hypothetical protein CJD36_002830 [Flavipsychrobacter stenotrophus]|uniref:Uncharacterized protein n=1 Tax=Flavipsychrobacter stenotrophus TaxID=2077091 RepID=A0A2S7T1R2_9BACT|nr:hypothetical protein [Flavipsychrobacter stenotrophus]PQJ12696.1 hypothetical protein CJD36_002830 [Flavipsychrobacter stenotrophus]
MDDKIKEYKQFLQSIIDEHSPLPSGGTVPAMLERVTAFKKYMEDFNDRGTSKANSLKASGVSKDELMQISNEYFHKLTI